MQAIFGALGSEKMLGSFGSVRVRMSPSASVSVLFVLGFVRDPVLVSGVPIFGLHSWIAVLAVLSISWAYSN